MAKHGHRLFEIFDLHDEACDALATRGGAGANQAAVNWEDIKLDYLAVKIEDSITKVRFKKLKKASEPDLRDFRSDFAILATNATRNDKLLFDFTGMKTFSHTAITALGSLSNSLRHKGSRIVLCCLNDSTKACFFPTKV